MGADQRELYYAADLIFLVGEEEGPRDGWPHECWSEDSQLTG